MWLPPERILSQSREGVGTHGMREEGRTSSQILSRAMLKSFWKTGSAEDSCLKPYGEIFLESRMIPKMVYGKRSAADGSDGSDTKSQASFSGRFGGAALMPLTAQCLMWGCFPINQRCVFSFSPLNSLTVSVFAPSCTKSGCSSVSKLLLLFCSRPAPV